MGGAPESAVIQAMNQQFDVSASFPELVMRLLNINGLLGEPNRPRFVDLDSHFPDGRLPEIWQQTLTEKPITFDVFDVEGMGYRFYRVSVPPESSSARSDGGVWVNISGNVTTRDGKIPVLDALVRGPNGDYRRQRITYHGDGMDVCVAEDLLLVLSNNSTRKADDADGTFELRRAENAAEDECARIEVTNPQTYLPVAEAGERIEVEGKESDDRPDVMPLVLTVFDVDPEDVDDYRVDVTLI